MAADVPGAGAVAAGAAAAAIRVARLAPHSSRERRREAAEAAVGRKLVISVCTLSKPLPGDGYPPSPVLPSFRSSAAAGLGRRRRIQAWIAAVAPDRIFAVLSDVLELHPPQPEQGFTPDQNVAQPDPVVGVQHRLGERDQPRVLG